jgi:hypothetical protein
MTETRRERVPRARAVAARATLVALAALTFASTPTPTLALAASTPAKHESASGTKPRKHKPKTPPIELALTPALVSTPGATVAMAPVGLSLEYSLMANDLGGEPCPPPALVAELQRLGSPPLELGGASQDETAPSGALSSPTSWQTATLYSLPSAFWSQLHCLLSEAKDPLTAGLNMRTGNLAWATTMVSSAQAAATNGLSFSLGNEPDLFGVPNYASLARPLPAEETAASNLYLGLVEYLRPAVGSEPLIGPELARPDRWRSQLPRVLAQLHAQTVGVHAYPLTACGGRREATIERLLSEESADEPSQLAWVVADARAAGAPAIISEASSASCGGVDGVSNAPASAVWAVRFVLSALKSGFEEVRFHSSGGPYDPFVMLGRALVARPIERALVALNQWLPVGATLRSVPGVRGLVATAIGEPPSAPTGSAQPSGGQPAGTTAASKLVLILDNEGALARTVVLRGVEAANVSVLSASAPGLATYTRRATHGEVRVKIATGTLVAVSPLA